MAQYRLTRPRAGDSWDAFDQLRREMGALFDRFGGPALASSGWQGVFPAVNLYESADAYHLTAELPGVAPGDIDVSIEGATVTLSGERKAEHASKEQWSLHRRERRSGSFRRAFQLPAEVDAERIEAVHRNGVLTLRLPKTAESQPRRIAVQAG